MLSSIFLVFKTPKSQTKKFCIPGVQSVFHMLRYGVRSQLVGEVTPLSLDLFTKFIYATKADDDKVLLRLLNR